MADFVKNVMKSTQEVGPDELRRKQAEMERRASSLQSQFGEHQSYGTPRIGLGTRQGAEDVGAFNTQAEFQRRKEAAANASSLGTSIDQRKSQVSNEVDAALRRRQALAQKYDTKQSQDLRESALNRAEQSQKTKETLDKMDFNMYKSQTDRNDKLSALFRDGEAEQEMAKAAFNGSLKQQDIDKYFNMLKAQMESDFNKYMKQGEMDIEGWQASMKSHAANMGAIMTGSTAAFGVLAKKYGTKGTEE